MGYVTMWDDVEIFYKDRGPRDAQVIFFHYGQPLSADDQDAQILLFLDHGYRVVAHDRRGHGRPNQVWDGHSMDYYADDAVAVVDHLGIQGVIHVGHSTGGGEVIHYIAYHDENRASKAAIISAVPLLMVQATNNSSGLPESVLDDLQSQLKANRTQSYCDVPVEPFHGYNRPGTKLSEGIIQN